MKALKIIVLIIMVIAALSGALWIAGGLFLVINKINPLNVVTLSTWYDYWQHYGHEPQVLRQLMVTGLVALTLVAGLALMLVHRMIQLPLYGESRFANAAEIQATGLFDATGIIVGKWGSRFLQFGTQQFVSLLAPTRSGKGVGIVIPNLLNYADSVVVLDVKLENWATTSKYRAMNGQATFLFNPFTLRTHRYNPLAYVSDHPAERVSDLLSIGNVFYPRATGNRETIWNDSARDLFVGLALYLLETPDLTASIGETLRQASGKGKPLKEHLQGLIHTRNFDAITTQDAKGQPIVTYEPKPPWDGTGLAQLSDKCVESLSRFIAAPENTAGGILTTFTAPLTLWASTIVDAATSGNDFDLRRLRRERMSVYIGIPVNKLPESSVLLRVFFSQLITLNTDQSMDASPQLKHTCLVLLDEFMTPKYIPMIAEGSAYIASYGLRLLTIAQSKAQIASPVDQGGYGREGAKALLDNHALNILYTPKDIDDANEYSERLGYDTVKSQSRNLRNRWQGSESDQRRALMLPQELLRLSQKHQIIQLEGARPIKSKKIRYYAERVFVDRLKSVSPMLAQLGRRMPSKEQMDKARNAGELSADVPVIDIDVFEARRQCRVRAMRPEDTENGINLDALAVDLSAVALPQSNTMSMEDAKRTADAFFSVFEDADTGTEHIDLMTGEITSTSAQGITTDYIDLSLLHGRKPLDERENG